MGSFIYGLAVITVLLSCYVTHASGCYLMRVDNTNYQNTREGYYKELDTNCFGRASYQQTSSAISTATNFLYFLKTEGGWSGWVIGSGLCSTHGGISAAEDVETPDLATGFWREYTPGGWVENYKLTVTCHEEGGGSSMTTRDIVGTVFGVIFLIAFTAAIIACCCCCFAGSRKPTTTRHGRNTVAVATTQSYHRQTGYNRYPGYYPPMAPPPYAPQNQQSGLPPQGAPLGSNPASVPAYTPGPNPLYDSPPPCYSEATANPVYAPPATDTTPNANTDRNANSVFTSNAIPSVSVS